MRIIQNVVTWLSLSAFACGIPHIAFANDTEAAVGVGGLEVQKNNDVEMQSEYLYVSRELIEVKYKYLNTSQNDLNLLVTFPVPNLPQEVEYPNFYPNFRDLNFHTTVDGKEVTFDYSERVEVDGRDVGKRIEELGWIKVWSPFDDASFLEELNTKLSANEKKSFLAEGLLVKSADDGSLIPGWTTKTYITRQQVFPAGRTIEVIHRYRPMLGSTVAFALKKENRADYLREYKKRFCVDKAFLAGFDRRKLNGKRAAFVSEYQESWLSYILRTGANWRGPIKDFHLVVDKGNSDTLISTCFKNINKISKTQFEVRQHNFEPNEDLDILFVDLSFSPPN